MEKGRGRLGAMPCLQAFQILPLISKAAFLFIHYLERSLCGLLCSRHPLYLRACLSACLTAKLTKADQTEMKV